jgi:hypothetical protein
MWFKGNKTAKEKEKKLFPSFPNSMGQSCRQSWACSPAKHASFANKVPLPTALSIAVLLAKGTAAELTASPLRQRYTWLLAKLSQQDPRSCWRRALSHHLKRQRFFPNRNSETLLGKPSPTGLEHAFPVVS